MNILANNLNIAAPNIIKITRKIDQPINAPYKIPHNINPKKYTLFVKLNLAAANEYNRTNKNANNVPSPIKYSRKIVLKSNGSMYMSVILVYVLPKFKC